MGPLFPLLVVGFLSVDSQLSEEYDNSSAEETDREGRGNSIASDSLDCVEVLSEPVETCCCILPLAESNDLENDVEYPCLSSMSS